MSIPQTIVSSPAARQGFQKGELTRCHVNPPGGRQQAGSTARDSEGGTHSLSCQSLRRASAGRQRGGVPKGELTRYYVSSPGDRQLTGSAARDSEGGTYSLSCQFPRRLSAHWQRGKGFRRGNSLAIMSVPQAIVSSLAARQEIQKGELTGCNVNPPGERQEVGSATGGSEGGTHMLLHVNPPGERQQAGSAAGDSEGGTHKLSCKSPRRASASWQRGKGFRGGNSLAVMPIPQASVSTASWQRGKRFRRGNSRAVTSIPQASVSKPAARQGIQKGGLTCCHVNSPGECQLTDSAARDSEGGTHELSCQSPRGTSASRQRGKGFRRGNSLAVMSIPRRSSVRRQCGKDVRGGTHLLSCQSPSRASASPQRSKGFRRGNSRAVMSSQQAIVSSLAVRQGIQQGELTSCQVNPPGDRQRAGRAARISEGGTHRLSCQTTRRILASQQRGN